VTAGTRRLPAALILPDGPDRRSRNRPMVPAENNTTARGHGTKKAGHDQPKACLLWSAARLERRSARLLRRQALSDASANFWHGADYVGGEFHHRLAQSDLASTFTGFCVEDRAAVYELKFYAGPGPSPASLWMRKVEPGTWSAPTVEARLIDEVIAVDTALAALDRCEPSAALDRLADVLAQKGYGVTSSW